MIPVWLCFSCSFSTQEIRLHSENWPYLFKTSSEIFKELETSAQMLFPWTPVMFLPRSERENNVWFLTWTTKLKKSVSFPDWQAGSLGGWQSWARLPRARRGWGQGGWRPWLLHPWCDGETWPSSKKRRRLLLKAGIPQGDILMYDGWNKIK